MHHADLRLFRSFAILSGLFLLLSGCELGVDQSTRVKPNYDYREIVPKGNDYSWLIRPLQLDYFSLADVIVKTTTVFAKDEQRVD